jgi:2,5-diketo-D-gluconate reductase B
MSELEAVPVEHVVVNGVRIPSLGFGTWQLRGDEAYDGVRDALEIGYRHVDTAQMYGNEAEVGRAIADSEVDREEIFLVTKVPPKNLSPADVRSSHEESLRRLGTDDVDLLLIHWPSNSVPLADTLEAMTALVEEGKTRHIGVSNFTPSLVDEARDHAEIIANQVEFHPFIDQSHLVVNATRNDLTLTAYSPLAEGRVVGDATLETIGEHHGKSAAQVAIRWLLQHPNVTVIPRSSSPEHREANFDVFDFELTGNEMERIAARSRGERLTDPPMAPDWER